MKSVLVGILVLSLNVNAGLKDKAREYSLKIVGPKWTAKVFGDLPLAKKITLPVIPDKIPESQIKPIEKLTSFDGLSSMSKRNYYKNFIKELSYVSRGIRIDEAGVKNWLNVLEQGGSQEGVYRAMVLDKVYSNLEDFEDPLTDKIIQFVQSYGSRFLKKTYSEKSLRSVNIYTIKRITTEKTLELVDYLQIKPDDLYRWYAVFSAEVAKGLRTDNRVRAIKEANYHYMWAQKVPIQHIKGEVIIKLHEILNQYNEKVN